MKIFLITLLLLSYLSGSCKDAIKNKSRLHPITTEEIQKEIENNLRIIEACKGYAEVVKEAELYNEYLLFKYLKLPTVYANDDSFLERCKRAVQ